MNRADRATTRKATDACGETASAVSPEMEPENRRRSLLADEEVFYELLPPSMTPGCGASCGWVEVALNHKTPRYSPPGNQQANDAFELLMRLAEALIREMRHSPPYLLDLSACYWSLHEPAGGSSRVRLCRSLSLVFTSPEKGGDSQIRETIARHLRQLGIPSE